jgi:hypothetical protein
MKAEINLPTALKILERTYDSDRLTPHERKALQRVLSRIKYDIQHDRD